MLHPIQNTPWSLDLKSLLEAIDGECLHKKEQSFSGVGSDSRQNLRGCIFFALSGPHFDGHDFLSQAVQQGATCLIVHQEPKGEQPLPVTWVKVPDTLKALQDLSVYWRKKLNLKVIAITGSCGKTTTKEFAKALLFSLKASASPKSYNNHWGVPLSLLAVAEPESFVIQELGINHSDEMASLCRLCDPFVSTVTTVAPAHLAGFKSLSHLANEKKKIYLKSPKASWIFNQDNPHTEAMYQELTGDRSKGLKTLTYSQNSLKGLDICFQILNQNYKEMEIEGSIAGVKGKSHLKFSGSHNVDNLMCACGIALLCGMSPENIWDQLSQCQTPEGRQKWFVKKDISVLFDAYNANPSSMTAFFEQFTLVSGRRFFILGDMKELGEESIKYHSALANHSALRDSEALWYIGSYGEEVAQALRAKGWKGKFLRTKFYEKKEMTDFKRYLKKGDVVGIKGSRSLKLEKAFLDLTGQVLSF